MTTVLFSNKFIVKYLWCKSAYINIFMTKVPPGISGQSAQYDVNLVSHETLANELSLLNIGDFEPLNIKIDTKSLMEELIGPIIEKV
jgi:hypothetical protein